MAIVMSLEWPGATLEEYDQVMVALGLDAEPPAGGLFHVSGTDGGTLRILDVWESDDAWNAFREGRLMPALEQTGLIEKGAPNVRTYPLHNLYAPGADVLGRLGASSAAGATG